MTSFDVRDYGAAGDGHTDNTAAFSACLEAVIRAGGGRMFLPEGVYRGRIIIPAVSRPVPGWITVEIAGEREPTPVFGTIGATELRENGTVVVCLAAAGPAVISASPPTEPMYAEFSSIHVVLRNLDVRTYDDPGIGGIDLNHVLQCTIENVFINTGVYNVQAAQPTHGARGLVTPAINNGAWTVLRNVAVTGYHTGILANEHTDGDSIVVASNVHGLELAQAYHASRFARVGAYRNTHNVTVTGRHGFSIEQLNIEHAGPGQTNAQNAWQATISDIDDPGNLGIGDIRYWVVLGNVGMSEDFSRNGGAGIRARRIGASPPS